MEPARPFGDRLASPLLSTGQQTLLYLGGLVVVVPFFFAASDGWSWVVLAYAGLVVGVAVWERHRVSRWWPLVCGLFEDVLAHTPELDPEQVKLRRSTFERPSSVSTPLPGGGVQITLSDGMRVLYGDPDAVWFVLAHEVAHQVLGHLTAPPETPEEERALRHRYELEADAWALDLALRAGRDREAGLRSLRVLGEVEAAALAGRPRPDTHPGAPARAAALAARLAEVTPTVETPS